MMHMEHRLAQTQSQRLMLTQKMQQALQILQYSGLELEQYVQQELETNPLLEQKLTDPAPAQEKPTENGKDGHDGGSFDDGGFELDTFRSRWEERIQEGRDLSVNPDMAARRDYYENSITREESLSAALMRQLRMAVRDENALPFRLGERVIGEIDDRGYFVGSLEEIAQDFGVPVCDAERALYRVQKFEPVGVGARDLPECLLLQINAECPDEWELKELVEHHIEQLAHRQIPAIAKAMNITPERVEELKAKLAKFDPWPGREFESEPTQYVTPDLQVDKVDDEFVVTLTGERVPDLQINPVYRVMTRNGHMNKEDKSFVRQKMESGKWLIRNIEQRQQTILRIGKAIMEVQEEFLRHGVDKIKPLTLQEIADKVGVHEATVSRTTRGKYIQTPQGLFELKYFFSPGLKTSSGEDQSAKSVQNLVKTIVDGEDKRKPLSDQKIADLLKAKGISIARRTVTKYREALGIPATTMRKEYQ